MRRHSSVSDVWGVCGLAKVRWAFCTRRRGSMTCGGEHPWRRICPPPRCRKRKKEKKHFRSEKLRIELELVFLFFDRIFVYLHINHLYLPAGIWQPRSSSLSEILWCHRVGFILTNRASIGGMKLFLTSCR